MPDRTTRRIPRHPPLTRVVLTATLVAAAAAVLSAVDAWGDVTAVIWWIALLVAAVAAVPTAALGVLDLRALRGQTRAARTATVHAAVMAAVTAILVIVTVRGVPFFADRDVDPASVAMTLVVLVGYTLGGLGGAVAMHVYGAGLRDETLRADALPRLLPVGEED